MDYLPRGPSLVLREILGPSSWHKWCASMLADLGFFYDNAEIVTAKAEYQMGASPSECATKLKWARVRPLKEIMNRRYDG